MKSSHCQKWVNRRQTAVKRGETVDLSWKTHGGPFIHSYKHQNTENVNKAKRHDAGKCMNKSPVP